MSLQVETKIHARSDPGFLKLDRLTKSLRKVGFSGDLLFWRGFYPAGSPSHFESPWGFKTFCFMEAMRLGYDTALWLDSSAVAIRSINPILALIEAQGYALIKHRYIWGEWCSDEALQEFGISRDASFSIPEVFGSAIGLRFSESIAREFLDKWHGWATEGSVFRGTKATISSSTEFDAIKWNINNCISNHPRVKGHRHDQTAAGFLAYRLGMTLSDKIATDCYSGTFSNHQTAIFIERNKDVSLSEVLRRVYLKDRLKSAFRYIRSRLPSAGLGS